MELKTKQNSSSYCAAQVKPHKITKTCISFHKRLQSRKKIWASPSEAREAHDEIIKKLHFLSQTSQIQEVNLGQPKSSK
jgi:hypothetical protein